jgi:hypothetical protein
MTRIVKSLSLLSALALWQGCSSSSDNTDASDDVATGTDTASDGPAVGLSRGTNFYKVTAVTVTSDACDIGASDFINADPLPVTYVDATQTLSVGNQVGSPVMPSLGSGVIGVMGTLMRENQVAEAAPSTCVWHQKDVSLFNLTGVDIFTLDVIETQSMFTAGCDPIPPGGTCMSAYKLTLTKTAAPADGGTGG